MQANSSACPFLSTSRRSSPAVSRLGAAGGKSREEDVRGGEKGFEGEHEMEQEREQARVWAGHLRCMSSTVPAVCHRGCATRVECMGWQQEGGEWGNMTSTCGKVG